MATLSSMEAVPNELLVGIARYLGKKDLASLALVSQEMRPIAQVVLHQSVHIEHVSQLLALLRTVHERSDLGFQVRYLRVENMIDYPELHCKGRAFRVTGTNHTYEIDSLGPAMGIVARKKGLGKFRAWYERGEKSMELGLAYTGALILLLPKLQGLVLCGEDLAASTTITGVIGLFDPAKDFFGASLVLHQLKSLDVAIEFVFSGILHCCPKLQVLKIRGCTKSAIERLERVWEISDTFTLEKLMIQVTLVSRHAQLDLGTSLAKLSNMLGTANIQHLAVQTRRYTLFRNQICINDRSLDELLHLVDEAWPGVKRLHIMNDPRKRIDAPRKDIPPFSDMRQLSISLAGLSVDESLRNWQNESMMTTTELLRTLPPNLESLHVHSCDDSVIDWLRNFASIVSGLTSFRSLDIKFKTYLLRRHKTSTKQIKKMTELYKIIGIELTYHPYRQEEVDSV
ncbi:hypothetical protein K491DRAFT_762033 [Lophiostoma macrostomum CBS 122681]|uniref:F-box domain-containing protein n=1 Tax=Lophiostoma macrostomum CBS 122681 TaxID=1314788 RepID=A0A6A6SQ53_9PLEO|nr:hypothetical protein K491DRAFT_762033 [Lophiostoma macrostomum CBS 122681]